MRVIKIEVDKDGKVTIDHQGFTGDACFKEDEKLYRILKAQGAEIKIEEVKKKPEAAVKGREYVVER